MTTDRHRTQPWREYDVKDVVTIDLSSHPRGAPLGILLAPVGGSSAGLSSPSESRVTILAGWERVQGGNSLGPIQRSGQVRLGDRLVRMNNVDVTNMIFRDIMDLLKSMVHGRKARKDASGARLRSISFAPIPQSAKKETVAAAGASPSLSDSQSQAQQGKFFSFNSSVRRARLRSCSACAERNATGNQTSELSNGRGSCSRFKSDDQGDDKFVEYEILCRMSPRFGSNTYQSSGGNEKIWSVWKRYSEFKALDERLRKSYEWQMNALNNGWGVSFPSSQFLSSILLGNLNKSFVEQRRLELEKYWQAIQKVREIFDFANPKSSHRYPHDMSSFLDVERHFSGRGRGGIGLSDEGFASRNSRERDDVPRSASQLSFGPCLKEFASPSSLVCSEEDKIDTSKEIEIESVYCSHDVKDVVIDSDNMPPSCGTAPRRKIGGAAKSAYQRNFFDSM